MKKYASADALAKDMGIAASVLADTFAAYNKTAEQCVANKAEDQFGKKFFRNFPFTMEDEYHVAIIVPVLHYCMGGLMIDADSQVLDNSSKIIPGLYAAGEVAGGVHGQNRLGGNSLLDCVVFGRVAGDSACRYLLQNLPLSAAVGRAATLARHITSDGIVASVQGANVNVNVEFDGSRNRLVLDIQGGASTSSSAATAAPTATASPTTTASPPASAAAPAAAPVKKEMKAYTPDEVAKHNAEKDCWVSINGQVLNVTNFLPDHPGGKKAILLFAGRDASEEFNMLHKPDVIPKYAPDAVIGTLKK